MYVMISSEDMKLLEGYERTFTSAINSNYARHFGSRQYNELNEVFERITGHKYKVNYGCSYCALGFIKAIGQLYFAEKDRLALEAAKVQSQPEHQDVTTSEPKKKRGRPKKVATNNEQKPE